MDVQPRAIVLLVLEDGTVPFEEWLAGLEDDRLRRAVDARIVRVRDGNFGDHRAVGEGVHELRIDKGPGLRVYYGLSGRTIVVLLGGGAKSTQASDIKKAKRLWKDYLNEN